MRSLNIRKNAYAIGALVFAGFGACGPSRAAAPAPYTFNFILSLTGTATFLGSQEKDSFEIEEKMLNKAGGVLGRPVKFVFYDDQSNPQVGVQLFQKLAGQKAPFIIGSSIRAVCNAMAPLAKHGPLLYCVSNSFQPAVGSFGFSGNVSSRDTTAALMRFIREKGWFRVATITSTDATGQEAEQGIAAAIAAPENKDIKLVSRVNFNPSDVSVAAQVQSIAQSHPDILIAWSTGTPIATVFNGIAQNGFDKPVATTNANQILSQMAAYKRFLPKDLYMPCPDWLDQPGGGAPPEVAAAHRAFFDTYKSVGKTPDGGSILGWDIPLIIGQAISSIGENADADQLRAYIANLKQFGGVNGLYDFRETPQRGLNISSAIVTQWDPKANFWTAASRPGGQPLN